MDFSILDQVLTKFNRVNEKADVFSCYSIMHLVIVPWLGLEREREANLLSMYFQHNGTTAGKSLALVVRAQVLMTVLLPGCRASG